MKYPIKIEAEVSPEPGHTRLRLIVRAPYMEPIQHERHFREEWFELEFDRAVAEIKRFAAGEMRKEVQGG